MPGRLHVQPVPDRRRDPCSSTPGRVGCSRSCARRSRTSSVTSRKLRYVSFSHVEADECGSLNEWLAVAPRAEPVCSTVAAMVSVTDLADRPPRALADGEELSLGTKQGALARRSAPAAQLGVRLPVREHDAHAAVRRSVHARRRRRPAADRDRRCSRRRRRCARRMGGVAIEAHTRALLEKLASHRAGDARAHARQLVSRRRQALLRGLADALCGR